MKFKQYGVAKRGETTVQFRALVTLTAVVLALLTASVILLVAKANPVDVYVGIVQGCFGSLYRFSALLEKLVPLLILSLGVVVAFKMNFMNIGAEGQFLMGGVGATLMVRLLPNLSAPVLLPLMGVVAFIFGALWLIPPAFFKSKFETNETLFTLMMNYVATYFVMYLQYERWKDPAASGMPKIANFPENALLPQARGFHLGIIIAILLVGIVYILMNRTKTGYEIAVLGASENTARYAGMNVHKTALKTAIISGGICGLVGMIQTAGPSGTLSSEITGGLGFTAIIVAWLADLKPVRAAVVSFLFAILIQGGSYIQTAFQIPGSAAAMIQAIILLYILSSEFFLRYRIIKSGKSVEVA